MIARPKLLNAFALLAALLATFPAHADSDRSARIAEGGAHGGGTDANLYSPLSIVELRNIVANLKEYLLPVLLYQERLAHDLKNEEQAPGNLRIHLIRRQRSAKGGQVYTGVRLLKAAHSKVFPGSGTVEIANELSRVKFTLKESGACVDLKFQDKDATAFNEDPNEICLSAERLLPKLTMMNVMTELLSVAGHELAHRMGADETEALMFQSMIRLTQRSGDEVDFQRRMVALKRMSSVLVKDNRLAEGAPASVSGSLFRTCMEINHSYMGVRDVVTASRFETGLSTVTQNQLTLLSESYNKLHDLKSACDRASMEKTPQGDLSAELGSLQQKINEAKQAGWGSGT